MINKKLVVGIVLCSSLVLFGGCNIFQKKWTAFIYPYWISGDESGRDTKAWFSSLEDCRAYAESVDTGVSSFDYECGVWCRYDESFGLTICKETRS